MLIESRMTSYILRHHDPKQSRTIKTHTLGHHDPKQSRAIKTVTHCQIVRLQIQNHQHLFLNHANEHFTFVLFSLTLAHN